MRENLKNDDQTSRYYLSTWPRLSLNEYANQKCYKWILGARFEPITFLSNLMYYKLKLPVINIMTYKGGRSELRAIHQYSSMFLFTVNPLVPG